MKTNMLELIKTIVLISLHNIIPVEPKIFTLQTQNFKKGLFADFSCKVIFINLPRHNFGCERSGCYVYLPPLCSHFNEVK